MILSSNFTSKNGLSLPNTLLRLLSVEHGEEQTQTRFTKNLAGKSFIIGDGTDVYVTFINCNVTKDHYTYNEIPHQRAFSYKLRIPNVFESSAKSTDRFTHTYFQNCVREWNQLDQSIRNCPMISGFKLQLVRLVRPTKKSIFGVHDIEGVRLLTCLRVQFNDLREHRSRHRFHCSNPMCLSQTGIEDNEHFLLHCPHYINSRKDHLDRVSNIVDRDLDSLTSIDLCNLPLHGNSQFPFDTNHSIIESTITFIKSTNALNKFSVISFRNTSHQNRLYLYFSLSFIFALLILELYVILSNRDWIRYVISLLLLI